MKNHLDQMSIPNSYLLLKADGWVLHHFFFLYGKISPFQAPCGVCLAMTGEVTAPQRRIPVACSLTDYMMLLQSSHSQHTLSYLPTAKLVT